MIQGLKPVSARDARILILGSMPGEASLQARQYYARPQNAFWKIMTRLLGPAESYPAKKKLLKNHKIALWDVVGRCRRKGSLDTAIKNPRFNAIEAFLKKHPKIKHVYLNGGTAYAFYTRCAKGRIDLPHTRLPSSSPANTMKFELKLKAWRRKLWSSGLLFSTYFLYYVYDNKNPSKRSKIRILKS